LLQQILMFSPSPPLLTGLLQEIPQDAVYRQNVEKLTKHRLKVCEEEQDWPQIEERIQNGQIEELIAQAKDELELIPKMAGRSTVLVHSSCQRPPLWTLSAVRRGRGLFGVPQVLRKRSSFGGGLNRADAGLHRADGAVGCSSVDTSWAPHRSTHAALTRASCRLSLPPCGAEWKPWAVPADYMIEMVEENNAIPSHIPSHIPADVDISVFPPPSTSCRAHVLG